MIALYLLTLLCYAFNTTVILGYVKENGKFEVIDLAHIVLSPITVVNIFFIKILSHMIPLDYILWSRDNDKNSAQR
jgi:hypothetical protein